MIATGQLSIEKFIQQNSIPHSTISKSERTYCITFSVHDVLFNQHKIVLFWKTCNQFHLKPVAKTFLGRVRSISFSNE